MRLIQFNSGLRVVLKDVQQQQETEHSQRYYLAAPRPAHHSSNSSIATTSSSIKSNGSIGTANECYTHRQYAQTSHSTIYHQCNRIKTPPVVNAIPSSTILVEVGISVYIQWTIKTTRTLLKLSVMCMYIDMCHICSKDRHVFEILTFFSLWLILKANEARLYIKTYDLYLLSFSY
jgi:hypothetical protein